jgi:hypothetical protein
MRSVPFTLTLMVVALVTWGAVGWRVKNGNLNDIFGSPATEVGKRLYEDFAPEEVARVRISGPGMDFEFEKTDREWRGVSPWRDRVDPRHVFNIIGFTLGLRVEDAAPTDEVDRQSTGLESPIKIHLLDAAGETLARYRMGRRTPWSATFPDTEGPVPTVYIHARDHSRKDHIYICTGDIIDLFKEGGRFLRDHHSLYFNPAALQRIRIRDVSGELTLGRETPGDPWRIIKPLDLRTDVNAVRSLLTGLHGLQAVRLLDRSAVTLPPNSAASTIRQIALVNFGSDVETLLEIHPPATADARDVLATVSDRPDTVFELPIKPEPGLISLADLPLTLNELRDPTLAHLNVEALREIRIHPSTAGDITLVRQPPQRWQLAIDGQVRPANEQRLYELLHGVTASRAVDFQTDAATDLSKWGLDRPTLRLEFIGESGPSVRLNFGMDIRGNVYVHRPETTSVMRVDPTLLSKVSILPYEWRHERVLNVTRVYLMALERSVDRGQPLELRYDDLDASWTVIPNRNTPAPAVDPNRANFLLTALEQLRALRWLAPGDPDATEALANPAITIALTERHENDQGDYLGLRRQELRVAPVPGSSPPAVFYGQLAGDLQPFLLDRATVEKLAMDLGGN